MLPRSPFDSLVLVFSFIDLFGDPANEGLQRDRYFGPLDVRHESEKIDAVLVACHDFL